MKNLKIFALVLTLALLITAAVCTTAFAAEEAEAPVIVSKNLSYEDNTHLYYAVKVTANVTADNTTLNLYADASCENALATGIVGNTETLAALGGGEYIVFRAPGIAAKHITREVYAQAVTAEGGKSELCKYSVAEYLLERLYVSERLGKTVTEEQKALYASYLAYGANAQTLFTNSKIENPADKEVLATALNIARVVDGTFADGTTQKLFAAGSGASVVAVPDNSAVAVWQVTTVAADGTVTQTKTANTTDAIAIGGQTIITAPKVAPPLAFDSVNDASYFSVQNGGYKDSDITSEYPRGQQAVTGSIVDGKYVVHSPIYHNTPVVISRTGDGTGTKAVFEADITLDMESYNQAAEAMGAWVYFSFYDTTTGVTWTPFFIRFNDGGDFAWITIDNDTKDEAAYRCATIKDGETFHLRLEYYINAYGYNNTLVYIKAPGATEWAYTGRSTRNQISSAAPAPDQMGFKIELQRSEGITLTLDNVRFDGE